jgi:uncharacterized protein YndB with AHSA1/START domain
MDIHHAMIVRCRPERLYQALTRAEDLSVWMAAPAVIEPPGIAEVGAAIEFQYGQRLLRVEIIGLEAEKTVRWQLTRSIWALEHAGAPQVITWTLSPYETSTLVDFVMQGWAEDEEAYPSVSYKWASFMMRLKMYLGDLREIRDLLGTIEGWAQEQDTAAE